MIQGYGLVWHPVPCRMVQRISVGDLMADGGDAMVVWASRLVPLALCQAGLRANRRRQTT